jgi:dihydroflavonol-4-reductase
MTRVLITGGLGFLGSNLVREFARSGWSVRILNRPGKRKSGFIHPEGHEIVWGDIRDSEAVNRATAGCEVAVHTVSNFREARTDRDAFAINVGGTDTMLEAAARHRVSRVVLCSTIGVHGSLAQAPGNESSPLNPGDVYQETKVAAEQHARAFEQRTSIPVCILRPASLYGPGDLRMLKLFRMIQQQRFLMFGRGDAFFHPAFIEDVARAFVLAASHPGAAGETFIIGGNHYLPLRDLIRAVARHLGVPPPGLHIPLAPANALAFVCELACRPFGIEPPLHRRRMSFFRNNRAFSIEKARSVLGYRPQVDVEEGIDRTIAWYVSKGYLTRRKAVDAETSLRPPEAAVSPEAFRAPDTT